MRTRHRIPTIFNLYMVDVLCCALGCVILLWLVNFREAKQRAAKVGETNLLLAETRNLLASLEKELAALLADKAAVVASLAQKDQEQRALTKDMLVLRSQKAMTEAQLAKLGQERRDLAKELAALQTEKAKTEELLVKKTQEQRDLAKEMTAAEKRLAALTALVREKESLATAAARTADDLAERLRDADARLKLMRPVADLVPGLQTDVKTSRTKLAAAEGRLQMLEKEISDRKKELALAGKGLQDLEEGKRALTRDMAARTRELTDARRTIEDLQSDKKTLADQASRARAAAENRFAGIALTGRRVVFLVDMSGSMDLVDERTLDANKWVGVRETLAKIMGSLPDLEKFQVILFAEKASYLLGSDERWLTFDPQTSPDRVRQGMAAVKPRGNTNMYTAFEAAFHLRADGLDTIYVLSDGLPNIGPGLTAETTRTLKETERTDVLSQHVRQTLKSDWNRAVVGRPRVRINTVGFFYESPEVGAFLWALARENDGSFVGMSKP